MGNTLPKHEGVRDFNYQGEMYNIMNLTDTYYKTLTRIKTRSNSNVNHSDLHLCLNDNLNLDYNQRNVVNKIERIV